MHGGGLETSRQGQKASRQFGTLHAGTPCAGAGGSVKVMIGPTCQVMPRELLAH